MLIIFLFEELNVHADKLTIIENAYEEKCKV